MDITVALGGGGAKGNAHIGVLRRLEKEGFRIRAIAGTSFVGIVAAFYAAGRTPDEIETLFRSVDQQRLYGHAAGDGPSLLGVAGAATWLQETLGDLTFNDLRIPCALTGVDIRAGRKVILSENRVVDAILATIAIPGIFPPRRIQEWELVDGGVLDPVPVSVARALAPKLPVVAVALTPPVGEPVQTVETPTPGGLFAPIVRRIARVRPAQAIEILVQSMDIFNRAMTDLRFELDKPEVIIRPKVQNIPFLGTVDVAEVARLGDEAAQAMLPEIRQAVSWSARVARSLSRSK
jgi:NTE family protein